VSKVAEVANSDPFLIFFLDKSRRIMQLAGWLGFSISIAFTVLFNWGQADALQDQILLAITGIAQVIGEFFFIVVGGTILFRVKTTLSFKLLGLAMLALGITLVLWSIASTYGANSKVVAESTAQTKLAQQQVELINKAMDTASSSAKSLQDGAEAMRERAEQYGAKYNSKAVATIGDANKLAQQAADQSATAMQALDQLNNVDQEALAKRNPAQEVFSSLAQFTGQDENTISTIFLLTRATQVEFIVIFISAMMLILSWDKHQIRAAGYAIDNGFNDPETAPEPAKPSTLDHLKTRFTQGANDVADKAAYGTGNLAANLTIAKPAQSYLAPAAKPATPEPTPAPAPAEPELPMPDNADLRETTGMRQSPAQRDNVRRLASGEDPATIAKTAAPSNAVTVRTAIHNGQAVYPGNRTLETPTQQVKPATKSLKNVSQIEAESLLPVVRHEKFNDLFIGIATGKTPITIGKAAQQHSTGREFITRVLVLLSYIKVVSDKDGNGQRTVLKTLDTATATSAAKGVREFVEAKSEQNQEGKAE